MSEQPSVERELGAISATLTGMHTTIGDLATEVRAMNERGQDHEVRLSVLESEREQASALHERVKSLEARPRRWAIGAGAPIMAALIGVFLHGI